MIDDRLVLTWFLNLTVYVVFVYNYIYLVFDITQIMALNFQISRSHISLARCSYISITEQQTVLFVDTSWDSDKKLELTEQRRHEKKT